jgi:oligo-1,6-glucosidase
MDNPLVREEVKKILRYWLDKGVDGFREDVITYISKPEGLPNERLLPVHKGVTQYNMGPHLHEYLEEFKTEVLDDYDQVTLAEATLIKPKKALKLIGYGPNKVLDMVICFEYECADCLFTDYIPLPFSLRKMKRAFRNWQEKLYGKGWNMLYIENHDHPRIVSRYGSEKFQKESAKTLCAMYMFLQGTPFVYQGQEIGMIDWHPESADMYEDVQTRNHRTHLPEKKRLRLLWRASRDSARTPVQWTSGKYAGFSEVEPWFYVNDRARDINVEDQENDPDSVLNFYRKTIKLRKMIPVIKDGRYTEYMKGSGSFYVYSRDNAEQSVLVMCSFKGHKKKLNVPKQFDLSKGRLILSNYDVEDEGEVIKMRPYEVRVYLFE